MTDQDKERIKKQASKSAKLGEWYHISRESFINGATYEHKIAFNQGKIEGFNNGIEAVILCFDPVFKIDPKAENIILIIEKLEKCFEEIEKIKKPLKA